MECKLFISQTPVTCFSIRHYESTGYQKKLSILYSKPYKSLSKWMSIDCFGAEGIGKTLYLKKCSLLYLN